MQNKILNKYLRQYYIGGALFFGIAAGSGIIMHKNAQLHEKDKIAFQDTEYDTTDPFQMLSLLLIAICIYMGSQSAAVIYKTKSQANKLAKEYLDDMLKRHPDLQKYSTILKNNQKVKEIAAFACNYLSDVEQQRIIDIINKAYDIGTKKAINNAHIEITNIIHNHARLNPEYTKQILALIKGSNKTYVMNPNEHTR